MNLGLPRTAGALLSAAALVLGSATASSAAVWTHTDPTGDVRTVTYSSNGGKQVGAADPTLTTPDITRIRVAHNRGAVVVKATLAAGLPTDSWEWVSNIRTPTGRYYLVHAKVGQAVNLFLDRTFSRIKCRGLKFVVGSPRTLLTATIPRSCLGSPAWVRVAADVMTIDDSSSPNGFTAQADDANSASIGKNPVLSPKVLAPKGAKIA